MSISKKDFLPHTIAQNIESFSDGIPTGKEWAAKNIPDSEFNNLLKSFSQQLNRYENTINDLIQRFIPNFKNSYIVDWENLVGIPDASFTANTFTDEERRRNIIIKLAFMNLQTAADFVALGTILGLDIEVVPDSQGSLFPLTFPILLGGDNLITILIKNTAQNEVFPYTFPLTFPDKTVSLFEALCESQKPATDTIVFLYELP